MTDTTLALVLAMFAPRVEGATDARESTHATWSVERSKEMKGIVTVLATLIAMVI